MHSVSLGNQQTGWGVILIQIFYTFDSQRIKTLKKGVGFIYGFACEDTFEVLGLALCKTETIADKLAVDGARVNIESDLSECLSYVQSSLPAGVGIIGHILVNAADFLLNDALESAYSLFLSEVCSRRIQLLFISVHITKVPLVWDLK